MSELKCRIRLQPGMANCTLPWGHDGEHRFYDDEVPGLFEVDVAEHARRQQAVADAETLRRMRDRLEAAYANGVLFAGSLLEHMGTSATAPVADAQPPTDPSPSNPMRLAEAVRQIDVAMKSLGFGAVTLYDSLGQRVAGDSLAKALRDAAAGKEAGAARCAEHSESNAVAHRVVEKTARCVLAELTEGS